MPGQCIPCSGTKRRICPFLTHWRIPFRVAFFTPATSALSSTMQLNTFLTGGAAARMIGVDGPPFWEVGRWRLPPRILPAERGVCGCESERVLWCVVRRSECGRQARGRY